MKSLAKDWNTSLYRKFEAQRNLPIIDLVNKIQVKRTMLGTPPSRIIDLGCGPGNSTQFLHEAWPSAQIYGIDSSKNMIEDAKKRLPSCTFALQDIQSWLDSSASTSSTKQDQYDIIFANAVLQWLPDQLTIIPSILHHLSTNGIFAAQVPDTLPEPSHQVMYRVAHSPRWKSKLGHIISRERLPTITEYYNSINRYTDDNNDFKLHIDVWKTVYYHHLPSIESIAQFVQSTGMKSFLDPLTAEEQEEYISMYIDEVKKEYSTLDDGSVMFPFPRVFLLAQKLDAKEEE